MNKCEEMHKIILERTQRAWDYLTEAGFMITNVRPTDWLRPFINIAVCTPDNHYPGEAETDLYNDLMAGGFNGFVITSISPFVNSDVFEPTVEVAFLSDEQVNGITERQRAWIKNK